MRQGQGQLIQLGIVPGAERGWERTKGIPPWVLLWGVPSPLPACDETLAQADSGW